MEKPIVPPVPVEIIKKELSEAFFLRKTNRSNNEIYIVDAHSSPNVMRELGRLREEAFRIAGGGTGLECDIDSFDTMNPPCRQLLVWDPDNSIILGGYRFILGRDILVKDNIPRIATSHMFHFSDDFLKNYLPYTIELGRSFVRPDYQSSKAGAKAIFALDNLWDGLGALTVENPDIKYLFGKVTMYPSYNRDCRNLILYFINKYFHDDSRLVYPISPLEIDVDTDEMEKTFRGGSFAEDYKILNSRIREHGITIPPLVNAYMGLSPTMKVFGTAINKEFGNVEETGILISISDIFEEKKRRHIGSYQHH